MSQYFSISGLTCFCEGFTYDADTPYVTLGSFPARDHHRIGSQNFRGGGMYSIRRLGGAFTILLALNTLAFAQGTADIVGRVTDTSGGVLPAVTVTAENIATKNVRTTI